MQVFPANFFGLWLWVHGQLMSIHHRTSFPSILFSSSVNQANACTPSRPSWWNRPHCGLPYILETGELDWLPLFQNIAGISCTLQFESSLSADTAVNRLPPHATWSAHRGCGTFSKTLALRSSPTLRSRRRNRKFLCGPDSLQFYSGVLIDRFLRATRFHRSKRFPARHARYWLPVWSFLCQFAQWRLVSSYACRLEWAQTFFAPFFGSARESQDAANSSGKDGRSIFLKLVNSSVWCSVKLLVKFIMMYLKYEIYAFLISYFVFIDSLLL